MLHITRPNPFDPWIVPQMSANSLDYDDYKDDDDDDEDGNE